MFYNHFINTLRSEIRFEELLPIKKVEGEVDTNINYSYESGLEKTIDLILPMYAQDIIYGIILDAIPKDVKLVIIPDAGSNDYEQHKALKEKGIDVLIIDHHEADKISEDACIINNQLSK